MTLKMSPYFSDGMILQRDKDVVLRGTAEPRVPVSVDFSGKNHSAKADENGDWQINLGKFATCDAPAEMRVVSGSESIAVRDVLIGDVWLCAGQSNMELTLGRARHNYPDEMTVFNPHIRQLFIPQVYNFNEAGTLPECGWESFSPETAPNFTAAGYFFAKKLRERYGVPVGLLSAAVGGTPIAAWMSRDMLADFPEDLAEADKCRDGDYINKTTADYEAYERDYFERLGAADEGIKHNWQEADFGDTDWQEVPLCEPAAETGAYWYRKTIALPSELRGKKAVIYLGTAVDMDEVWINGEKIGETAYRYPPREYGFTLPCRDTLNITVRLLVFNKNGGFTLGKNYFIGTNKRTIDIGGLWKRKVGALFADRNDAEHRQTFFQYKPTGIYNGIVAPLSDYAIKGVIWYQGESDSGSCERYDEKTRLMVNGFRDIWGAELPFLATQLASYDDPWGTDWNRIRDKQKDALDLPNTGLAAAYDLGEHNDLHPLNKRDVGERLARLAARIAYGEDLPPNPYEMYNIGSK